MKTDINLQVDITDFCKSVSDDVVIVRKKGKWIGIKKNEFLKECLLDVNEIKQQLESYKVDNANMRKQIKNFEEVLVNYGFKLFEDGGNK